MKSIHLLLVEDNEGDILLTKETLNDAQIVNKVSVMRDGEQALNFLFELAKNNPSHLPDLILLDINLPKFDGIEVLKKIKADNQLKNIPVVVVTTSSSPADIDEVYREKANFVVTKPLDIFKLFGIVQGIDKIGISLVLLPTII